MAEIKNTPTIQDEEVVALRNAFAHRARWLKLLLDEAKARGADWESIGRDAVRKCGRENGARFKAEMKGPGLTDLPCFVGAKWARKVFEIEVLEENEDHYYMNFHHCPLVSGWQMEGVDGEELKCLCDIAMDGDRGVAEAIGAAFVLGKTIAEGCDVCELRFSRRKGEENN